MLHIMGAMPISIKYLYTYLAKYVKARVDNQTIELGYEHDIPCEMV